MNIGLTFANLSGFWGLLGIPAVLLIHMLQRESRRLAVSTLFLLEQIAPVSAQGKRMDRLRNSPPLWLQLLGVMLLTWLLVQPRWLRRDSTQSVVVLLDSSYSMTAFRDIAIKTLDARLASLAGAASHTEWVLLESDQTRGTLYSGGELAGLKEALKKWEPHLGWHDVSPALQTAQSLYHGNGLVIFVTDHVSEMPENVCLLACGEALENCGFIGLSASATGWHALVKNYGTQAHTRRWSIDGVDQGELTLEPGGIREINGQFSDVSGHAELALDADRFPLDDRLPMIRPQAKKLGLRAEAGTGFTDFLKRFSTSLDDVGGGETDLVLDHCNSTGTPQAPCHAIYFLEDPGQPGARIAGSAIAVTHPLTADLNWQSLICEETTKLDSKEGDEVLLWQGERPLIFLRGIGKSRSLVVNFDIRYSNATRIPAFIILLNRFAEQVRAEKPVPEARNLETNQLIDQAVRAPAVPGFFEKPLLKAAAHFADAREADFTGAGSFDGTTGKIAKMIERNSEQDFLSPVWLLMFCGICLSSWAWIARRP